MGKKNEKTFLTMGKVSFFQSNGFKSVISSVISIVAGLVIGLIVMMIIAASSPNIKFESAFEALSILLKGPFNSKIPSYRLMNFGDMIFYSTPLIFTGLSVAVAYKTGLFNIGAAGQMYLGAIGSLLVALNINTTGNPTAGVFVWILAVLVGFIMGAIWGAIPGIFKALFNVNEVIVCIMTNWIAANMTSWIFSTTPNLINTGSGKTGYLITTAVTGNGTPTLGLDKLFQGSYLDLGIILAIVAAIVVLIVLNFTTFGFELKACGSNKNSAKYVGMSEKRNIILSMAIAGGLAALACSIYYLNPGIELKWDAAYTNLPQYGFNGIAVSLLASNNPIGVIFTSVFLRYLNAGGNFLTKVGFNRYIADIIIAIIIYFAGFANFNKELLTKISKAISKKAVENKAKKLAAKAAVAETEVAVDPPLDVVETEKEDK